MPLKFHPPPGVIVICDYKTGFRPPEMVKIRPAVIVSPRLRRRDSLCTVVPLSTTPPKSIEPYHQAISFDPPLPPPWDSPAMWAKCDMLATVSFDRLDLVRTRRDPRTGRRRYLQLRIPDDDLARLRAAIRAALGL